VRDVSTSGRIVAMPEPTNEELLAELREVQQAQSVFIAQLVHQLRNGLAPIQNGLHVLRQRGEDGPTREKAVDVLERQVGLLAGLLDSLAKTARQAGDGGADRNPTQA
jgi:signal transduction histidine kinase